MLDKLAASPEPKVRRGPQATCYSIAMPRPEVFEYVCKKCGTHTVYLKNTLRIGSALARYREEAASLRALGLDIVLDESVLCSKCRTAKELNIATSGVILNNQDDLSLRAGEPVTIIEYGHSRCRILPLVQKSDYWISAQYISDKGEVLGNSVNIRSKPLSLGRVVARVDKGIVLKRLPAKKGDPKEWVRIEPLPLWKMKEDIDFQRGMSVATKDIGGFSYDEAEGAAPARFSRLAWVINGKRSIVQTYDARILKAFLTGQKTWEGAMDEERSLKGSLSRLNVLLGPDVKPPPPGRTTASPKTDGRDAGGSGVGANGAKVEVDVDI
ncbi:MAG: hypothetical protein IKJ89_09710 [Kiritimatiellae bacterium]|nr:hypothetical protein [Kiritimatiellia bacterium]